MEPSACSRTVHSNPELVCGVHDASRVIRGFHVEMLYVLTPSWRPEMMASVREPADDMWTDLKLMSIERGNLFQTHERLVAY